MCLLLAKRLVITVRKQVHLVSLHNTRRIFKDDFFLRCLARNFSAMWSPAIVGAILATVPFGIRDVITSTKASKSGCIKYARVWHWEFILFKFCGFVTRWRVDFQSPLVHRFIMSPKFTTRHLFGGVTLTNGRFWHQNFKAALVAFKS